MSANPANDSLRELAKAVALEMATKLSAPEALEIWRAMQLLATNSPIKGQLGHVILLAMDFNQYPEVWKVVAKKAVAYERKSRTRGRH